MGLRLRCELEGSFTAPNTAMLIPVGTLTFLPFIEELLTARYNNINVPKWHRLSLNLRKMLGSSEKRRLPASNSASKQPHMLHYDNQTRTKCLHSYDERVAISKRTMNRLISLRMSTMSPDLNFFGVRSRLDLVMAQWKTGGKDGTRESFA